MIRFTSRRVLLSAAGIVGIVSSRPEALMLAPDVVGRCRGLNRDGTCGKIPLANDAVRENAQGSRR